MDVLSFISGAEWEIIESCKKGDGTPLDLTDCTIELAIWSEDNPGGIFTGAAQGSPALGVAIYNITPAQQETAGLVGYDAYFFSCRVTTGSGVISYQNTGVLFVASNPWPV